LRTRFGLGGEHELADQVVSLVFESPCGYRDADI
jgi:hypothetical protein